MNVEAPERPTIASGGTGNQPPEQHHEASDDGSGNEHDWRQWNAETDGTLDKYKDQFTLIDLGRLSILGGRKKLPGLAEDFSTDRIAVNRRASPFLGKISINGPYPQPS